MIRQPGYYWVEINSLPSGIHRTVAKWTGKYWLLHGETFTVNDKSLHKIHPKQLTLENTAHFQFDWEALIAALVLLSGMAVFTFILTK